MNLKQKLLGFGLIAALGGCNDKLSNFSYSGTVFCRESFPTMTGVCMVNEKTDSEAYLLINNEIIPNDLIMERFRYGRMLKAQDCDAEIRTTEQGTTIYHLTNCRFLQLQAIK